jgi:hypothetical protein
VDLSEAILDEAEKLRPNLYNERIAGDVTEIFRQKKPLSLIVAADSYIYFGDLGTYNNGPWVSFVFHPYSQSATPHSFFHRPIV